jgi:ribosomal-protein-alanine N-acetyltransferase
VSIRLAVVGDVPAIIVMERSIPAAAHWTEQQYQNIFGNHGPRRLAFVGDDGGALIAFLIVRIVEAEWEIENLGVIEHARRHGTGTALMRGLLDLASRERASAVFLEVRASNVAARGLYRKVGFTEEGRRQEYYREPSEDAISYRFLFS